MSINVTVSGNPVNIKKGRMVTADPNYAKKEFDKRRLLRLEQVRQQSKDIAEDIRNKVRRQKQKQENEIEEEGRQKLKSWQNRKLLELQTQYREALQELGAGHKEAEELEDENEVVEERKEQNKKVASDRCRLAASKLQIDKNIANLKKSIPIQNKKLVRDIENTRAALVSNIKKKKTATGKFNKKTRKKASADISITIPESDSESEVTGESCGEEISEDILSVVALSSSYDSSEDSENPRMSLDINTIDKATEPPNRESMDQFELLGLKSILNIREEPTSHVPYAKRIRERSKTVIPALDTRISDRIRRREVMASQLDYCDIIAETNPSPFIKGNTQIREAIESRYMHRGPTDSNMHEVPLHRKSTDSNVYEEHPPHRKSSESNNHKGSPHRNSKDFSGQKEPSHRKSRDFNGHKDPSHRQPRNFSGDEAVARRMSRDFNGFKDPSHRKSRDFSGDEDAAHDISRDFNKYQDLPRRKSRDFSGDEDAPHRMSRDFSGDEDAARRTSRNFNGYKDPSHRKSRDFSGDEDAARRASRNFNGYKDPSHRKSRDFSGDDDPSHRKPRDSNAHKEPLHRKSRGPNTHKEIPTKPPIKLKESSNLGGKDVQPSKVVPGSIDSHKVQYYNHANRFSQEKLPNFHVEKITSDSIEALPNVTSEAEWHEKMRQRDREAHMRGQRALKKEKVQRDYQEIVKKLPVLQKKERVYDIHRDKPEFHMPEERMKERERKKQNDLDNAYTKIFPTLKPAVVTIPRRKPEADARMAPGDDEPTQSLNVAKWDVDTEGPKMFTIEEVQEIIKAFTGQEPEDRRAKLKELLSGLKLQKEQLLHEIRCLPRDESINELINDLNSVSDSSKPRKRDRTCKRKRCQEEKDSTTTDSTTESSSSSDSKPHRRRRSKFTLGKYSAGRGKTPSPRKKAKMKSKRSVLILQNTSTQTTPKTVCVSTSPHQDKPEEPEELPKKSIGQPPTCNKLHVPCDCNKENVNGAEELCQIFIKINDNEEPEVVVKAKEKEHQITDEISKTKQRSQPVDKVEKKIESKSIAIGTDETRDEITMIPSGKMVEEKRRTSKVSLSDAIEQPKREARKVKRGIGDFRKDQPPLEEQIGSKAKSWREQLSKNSLSSASTSYFSPPNFQGSVDQTANSRAESSKHSLYNLRKKPQQGNLFDMSGLSISPSQSASAEVRTIDPILLTYIKKLLSMSRDSVENLTVSTSNVQTPSQSVVEIDSNNPLAHLHNLIKYFNLKVEDIARELSYSPDVSMIQRDPSSSASERSLQQRRPDQKKRSKHSLIQSPKSELSEKESSTHTAKSSNSLMLQYTDVTDSCSQRIANLASMIQQIREEKIEMLNNAPGSVAENKSAAPSPADSERDGSTGYLNLPGSRDGSKHSSGNSSEDEEIHRRLLEIDLILANKLRKFTPLADEPILEEPECKRDVAEPFKEAMDKSTHELWQRLKRLSEADSHPQPADSQSQVVGILDSPKDDSQSFVSFLSDIPILPKLVAQPGEYCEARNCPRRPPPSKGLTIAKKFNGNITLVPHELSTIAEADSQVSTRISSSVVSPNTSKTSQGVTLHKQLEPAIPEEYQDNETLSSSRSSKSGSGKSRSPCVTFKSSCDDGPKSINKETDKSKGSKSGTLSVSKSSKSGTLSMSMDVSIKSQVSGDEMVGKSATAVSKGSVLVSSSSSDDLESIEAMLRSIGMEWAIPTLHKTNEALALASSSNSEISPQQQSKSSLTGSEISLKEFLSKQIFSKISSSSLISDASMALEFSDLSAIKLHTAEEKGKRTSTPITSSASKSKESLKQIFSNVSDISIPPVTPYDNQSFHTIPSEQPSFKNGG